MTRLLGALLLGTVAAGCNGAGQSLAPTAPTTQSAVGPVGSSLGLTIQSVTPIHAVDSQTIVITGTGFGPTFPGTQSIGDGSVDTLGCGTTLPSMAIWDNGSGSDSWAAGRVSCTNFDAIGLHIQSWSDTQIVLSGFGSALGTPGEGQSWNIAPGDPLVVVVFGPNNSGQATYNLTAAPSTSLAHR
jgi:hypothetical protein